MPVDGYPVCAPQVTGTCRVASVFKYLDYGPGVDAGFALTPITLQNCDLATTGSCSPAAVLTVGLNSATVSGYTPLPLTCPLPGYVGTPSIEGFAVCAAYTPGATISASAPNSGSVTDGVLFDTGTPWFTVNPPAGSGFPAGVAPGTAMQITLPNGYVYSYTAGTGLDQVVVASTNSPFSIAGLGYFTEHAFYIDYTSATMGWK